MSDQGIGQPGPGGYPQQPGNQVPPAPPGTPPPAYEPPPYMQSPAQPPVKRGKGGIVAAIVVVVAMCALAGCAVLGIVVFKGGSDKKSIEKAEEHFNVAIGAVESATASLEAIQKGDSSVSETGEVIQDAADSLRTARDEITSAGAIAEGWKDSQGKTDYLAGLAATTESLDALEDLVAYLDTASGMLAKTKKAGKEATAGNDALSDAVSAGNRSKYSLMRSKGQKASAHFVKAALLFREAHNLDKSAGLDKSAKYADLRKKQSDVVVRQAAAGLARRFSAYNADVKKVNAYNKRASNVGEPAIVSDPNWAEKRLEKLDTRITKASEQADELRSKALRELGYTQ